MVDMQAKSLGKICNDTAAQLRLKHTQILPDCENQELLLPLTHSLRNLLILEALEMPVLVCASDYSAALWLHPALRHQVELGVRLHSLHLSVVILIS